MMKNSLKSILLNGDKRRLETEAAADDHLGRYRAQPRRSRAFRAEAGQSGRRGSSKMSDNLDEDDLATEIARRSSMVRTWATRTWMKSRVDEVRHLSTLRPFAAHRSRGGDNPRVEP
jgi:hypothetical protein